MARFKGLLQFIGTLGNITAVKSKEGVYLKKKNDIPKSRYQKAPEYADFRMNGNYMAMSSRLSKAFRHPIAVFGRDACDPRMYSRMNALMRRIIMCDTVSAKGAFTAAVGMATAEGKQLVRDFEFHKLVSFDSVFHGHYTLAMSTGTLSLPEFEPKKHLQPTTGATHVGLQCGMLSFNFETQERSFTESPVFTMPLHGLATAVVLNCDIPAPNGETLFYFFKVFFMQEVNGVLYPLKGDGGAVMKVVGVD